MITRIALLALCSFYFTCHAQQSPKHIATLIDGTRIAGTILSDYNDSLKIAVTRIDTITINRFSVASISRVKDPSQLRPRDRGYQIQLTIGLLAGKSRIGNEYNMSFHLSNSYQLSNGLSLGFGCGAEYLAVPVLPIYGEVMYHFTNRLIAPYVYIKTGYSFAFVERDKNNNYYEDYYLNNHGSSKGGFLFNAGIGIANFTWNKSAVMVGAGYRYQKVTQTLQTWNGGKRELISNFNRIEIKFGFLFR